MGKKEKKPAKGADKSKEKKAPKADKPGTAKYEYPKDCVTDADKKKYRSLMRAGKTWEGPGKSGGKADKKGKKDNGAGKAAILDGKGNKVREESVGTSKKKKKKSED